MTHEEWMALTPAQREAQRAPAYPACLAPYLGMRIECTDSFGERRRFWVGKSTGWQPAYLEVKTRRSMGGIACDSTGYTDIRIIDTERSKL